MVKNTIGVIAVTLLFSASGHAANGGVVGVITGVERHSPPILQLAVGATDYKVETSTNGRFPTPSLKQVVRVEPRSVRTDEQTSYVKWLTHKPWEQDVRADDRSLAVGRCVEIDMRPGSGDVAEVVRINTDPARSVFDPCKAIR